MRSRAALRRAYSSRREDIRASYHLRAMQEATIERLGRTLRGIPGMRLPLDARVAWRERAARRRAELREAQLVERDRAWIASLAGRRDLRLIIGSSGEHVDGWINADIARHPDKPHLRMDATEPWPFASGSAEAVNNEHMIEHLDPAA